MGLGRRAAQRDVGGVPAPPQHRIRHYRQFIPPERAQALLVCTRIRSRAARPRPQHRDLERRQLVGIGRAARKRVRGSVSHAEERRLRGVAASRQGASQPPGTDSSSRSRAVATSDAEFRSPARSQRINYKDIAMLAHRFAVSYQAALYRLNPLCREPSPYLPRAVPGAPGTGSVRATAPPGAQHGWRRRGIRTPSTVNCAARSLASPSRHMAARRFRAAASARRRARSFAHERRRSSSSGRSRARGDRVRR